MLQSKSFVKKTKQGQLVKVVREHYSRDDIYCVAPFCKVCDISAARLNSTALTILVVDTNIVLHQGDDPYFNKLIRILATSCMTQAVYFCSGDLSPPEFAHYGLAAPLYTHFTSPTRRYAGFQMYSDRLWLTGVADNLNYRYRNAQMANQSSVELHTLIYFRKRPTDTEARIVKVRSNGFIVFVPKYGIEGPVYLMPRGQKGGGEWLIDEQKQKIQKIDGDVCYGVLQTVMIHMEVVEPEPNRPKLQLNLI